MISLQLMKRGFIAMNQQRSFSQEFGYSKTNHRRLRSNARKAFTSKWWPFFSEKAEFSQSSLWTRVERSMHSGFTEVCLPAAFEELQQQRPKAGILLYHDNARPHVAARTMDFLHQVGVQLLPHPPYSPDLAPCDFYLFLETKKHLKGKRFQNEDEAIDAFRDILNDLTKNDFKSCFDK